LAAIVGVDIPDVSICVIEKAEMFGLSSLHQIRGRIGRGLAPPKEKLDQCYCILLYDDDEPDIAEPTNAKRRLQVLVESNDGFHIAEEDLKIRGGGEIFGLRQHGEANMRVASLVDHIYLMEDAIIQARQCPVDSPTRGQLEMIFGPDDVHTSIPFTSLSTRSLKRIGKDKVAKNTSTSTGTSTGSYESRPRAQIPFLVTPALDLHAKNQNKIIILDLETTGFSPKNDRIIQIAAMELSREGNTQDYFNAFIRPQGACVSPEIEKLTGISQTFLNNEGMTFEEAWYRFIKWYSTGDNNVVMLAHNGKNFDFNFLQAEVLRTPCVPNIVSTGVVCFVDTLHVLRDESLWSSDKPESYSLASLYEHVTRKPPVNSHNALFDVLALAEILNSEHVRTKWKDVANRKQFVIAE